MLSRCKKIPELLRFLGQKDVMEDVFGLAQSVLVETLSKKETEEKDAFLLVRFVSESALEVMNAPVHWLREMADPRIARMLFPPARYVPSKRRSGAS